MRLAENVRGISKLLLILLLLFFFALGATLSYIWTMGFYAPGEFNLPSRSNITIESLKFTLENATYFNVTLLNPSYSSDAEIEQIKVSTVDGKVYRIFSTSPALPITLSPGESQTVECFWNWGEYTGQTLDFYALIADGSGPAVRATAPFMNLTVTDVSFEPSITVTQFNVTVELMNSLVSVNITDILVNGAKVNVTQTLPYTLNPNASKTFTLDRDWTNLQNKSVTVKVNTLQGYVASKITVAPPPVVLTIQNVVFNNATSTQHFNVTVNNAITSPTQVDITYVTVFVENRTETITNVFRYPSGPLQPNSSILLQVYWDWSKYQGTSVKVTVNVHTSQGFIATTETQIP